MSGLPPLPKMPSFSGRQVFHGVLLLFLILSLNLNKSFIELPLKPEEVKIQLTQEIYANPILGDPNIWKVDRANLYSQQQDWANNDTLDSMEALEKLLENSVSTEKEPSVNLSNITSSRIPDRELAMIDIRSKAEKTMMKVANSRISTHTVRAGETILDISRRYGIDVQTIIGANPDVTNLGRLKAGQEIKILGTKGVIHKMAAYQTLSSLARLYRVNLSTIVAYNGLKNRRVKAGDMIVIPGANPIPVAAQNVISTAGYIWPAKGKLTSKFGWRWGRTHTGIDISVPVGTPVRASRAGRVTLSSWFSDYGNCVDVQHDGTYSTRYAHNSRLVVRVGEYVTQGQIIAYSGNTGRSTGPHVHFEVRKGKHADNPLKYLK